MSNPKHSKEIYEIVDKLRPIDDVFFTKLAEDREFCQEILQVILEMPKLEVVEVFPQKQLRNVKGRSVIVDVLCKDARERYFNIEVQKEDDDDHQRRVRYNGSNIETYITEKGISFEEMPDVYVVFISQFDYFKQGKTIYHIDRIIRETQQVVDNGYYEVYVNTKVDDGSDIAGLMKMFKSSKVENDKRFPATCKAISGHKEGKGRDKMCSIVEEYASKKAEEASAKTARATTIALIKAGVSDEIIKNATGLTEEEIEKLHLEIKA